MTKYGIENGQMHTGGNWFILKTGQFIKFLAGNLEKWGKSLIERGSALIVTNPSAEMINIHTVLFKFTVNGNLKYQLILLGFFKDWYKNDKELVNLTEEQLFLTINANKKLWFKKSSDNEN